MENTKLSQTNFNLKESYVEKNMCQKVPQKIKK